MSAINTDKLWLLQNEKALLAIIREPNRPLHSICQAHSTNFDALSDFLEKYCPEGASLTAARLHEVKIELGILSESRVASGANTAAAPAPCASAPAADDDYDDDPRRQEGNGIDPVPSRPWLKLSRRPKANTVEKYRSRIEAIAAGKARTGTEGSWYATLNKWFGTVNPTAAQAKLFLAYVDEADAPPTGKPESDESAPPPIRARKPRKLKAAKVPKQKRAAKANPEKNPAKRKYTRRKAEASAPPEVRIPADVAAALALTPEKTVDPRPVGVPNRVFGFSLFGFELSVRRRVPQLEAAGGAS